MRMAMIAIPTNSSISGNALRRDSRRWRMARLLEEWMTRGIVRHGRCVAWDRMSPHGEREGRVPLHHSAMLHPAEPEGKEENEKSLASAPGPEPDRGTWDKSL